MKKITIGILSTIALLSTLWFVFWSQTQPDVMLSAIEVQTNQKDIVDSNYIEPRFTDEVSLGNIKGQKKVTKFGRNPDIDTATDPEPVRSHGGDYNRLTTGSKIYVSSNNDSDNGHIKLVGLDENREEQEIEIQLNGQTPIAIDGLRIRTFRAYNSNSVIFGGDIYFYTTGTVALGIPSNEDSVVCYIDEDYQQTLMAIYTIPAGKVGLLTNGYITMQSAGGNPSTIKAANFIFYVREYGATFLAKIFGGLVSDGSSVRDHQFGFPLFLDEKTDMYVEVDKVTADDTDISAGFDLLLIDFE